MTGTAMGRALGGACEGLPVRALGFVLSISALGSAAPHPSDTERITAQLDLSSQADAEGCLDGESLERAVEVRWGRRIFVDTDGDVLVRGWIGRTSDGAGWTVRIRLSSPDGQPLGSRELETDAPHCSALDDSVALAVGLMLDISRSRLAELREEAAREVAEVPAPRSPEERPIRLPKGTVAPREPFWIEPAASGVVALGLLPGVALGIEASVLLSLPRFWAMELSATVFADGEVRRAEDSGAVLGLWTLGAALCPFTFDLPFDGRVCVTQRTGVFSSSGFGFDQNSERKDLFVNLGAYARGSIVLIGPLRLRGAVGLDVPVAGYRVFYEDESGSERELYRSSAVIATATFGIALRL